MRVLFLRALSNHDHQSCRYDVLWGALAHISSTIWPQRARGFAWSVWAFCARVTLLETGVEKSEAMVCASGAPGTRPSTCLRGHPGSVNSDFPAEPRPRGLGIPLDSICGCDHGCSWCWWWQQRCCSGQRAAASLLVQGGRAGLEW